MVRPTVFAALPVFALATAAAGFAAHQTGSANSSPAAPRLPAEISLSRLTPDATVTVRLNRGAVATDDAIWTVDPAAGTLTRIEAKDNAAGAAIAVGREPCASLAAAFDAIWVPLCGDGAIVRVDAKSRAAGSPVKIAPASGEGRIAASVGSLWVLTDSKGVLSRIDPAAGSPVAEIYVAGGAASVAAGDDALWVTSTAGHLLTRVNPHTLDSVATVVVGPEPGLVTIGEGAVWTLNRGDGSVTRVDPATNKAVATIAIGSAVASGEIAAGAGSIWISAAGAPLVRIDPRTNRVAQRFSGEGGGAVLIAHGSLWLAAGPKLTWRLDPLLVAGVRP